MDKVVPGRSDRLFGYRVGRIILGLVVLSVLPVPSITGMALAEEKPRTVSEKSTVSERVAQATTLVVQPVYFAGRLVWAIGGGIYGSVAWFGDEEAAKKIWRASMIEAPWVWHRFLKIF